MPSVPTCQHTCVPAWFTCQRACVLVRFTCQCACVPTSHFYMLMHHTACQCFNLACQYFNLACQRAKRHVDFSNIPLTKCYWKFLYFIIIKKFYIICDIIVISGIYPSNFDVHYATKKKLNLSTEF